MRRLFPATEAALKGWTRLSPGTSRPPIPREVLLAIVRWMFLEGRFGMGLCLLVMFETYGRPSEIMSLRRASILAPVTGGRGKAAVVTVVIRATMFGQPGKTGEHDLSVPLDLPRQAWVATLLLRWCRDLAPTQPLWNFDLGQLSRALKLAAVALQLAPLAPCPYQMRHGGASHDRLVEARPMLELQARGGWKSFASVRRYDKHGIVGMELMKLAAAVRTKILSEAASCAADCVAIFSKRCAQARAVVAESSSSSSLGAAGSRKRSAAEALQS